MKSALFVEATNTLFFPVSTDISVDLAIKMVKSIRAQADRDGFNVVVVTGVDSVTGVPQKQSKRKRRIGKARY